MAEKEKHPQGEEESQDRSLDDIAREFIGRSFKVRKENINAVRSCLDTIRTTQVAFQRSTEMLKNAEEQLWEVVHILFPDLKGYHLSINHDSLEVTVLRKLKPWEKIR